MSVGDGVRVDTSYFTAGPDGRRPAVLLGHGFGGSKDDVREQAEDLARDGYAVLTWSARGFGGSTGKIGLNDPEGEVADVSRLIDWLAGRPEVELDGDGDPRVGMAGGSYVGAVQWQAAVERPPGLAAIAPQATWSSFHRNLYLGGAVRLALIAGWIASNTPRPDGLQPADMNEALLRLPLADVDEAIGWPMPWLDAYLTRLQSGDPDGNPN